VGVSVNIHSDGATINDSCVFKEFGFLTGVIPRLHCYSKLTLLQARYISDMMDKIKQLIIA